MNRRIGLVLLVAGCFVTTGADRVCEADAFNPQNGHTYRLVRFPELRWDDARLAATNEPLFGVAGYLATITSAEEHAFVEANFLNHVFPWGAWLGGYQPAGSGEPAGNWQWVTGEPFSFANWHPGGEPSNANNNENQLQLMTSGYWNDLGTSEAVGSPFYDLPYLVEFNVPEPGSLLMSLAAIYVAGGLPRRGRRGRG